MAELSPEGEIEARMLAAKCATDIYAAVLRSDRTPKPNAWGANFDRIMHAIRNGKGSSGGT